MEEQLAFNTSYFFAFMMGLFSSLHCLGMCGSIIGTLTLSLKPEIRRDKRRLFPFILNYNLGRVFSYTTAGAIAGTLHYVFSAGIGAAESYRAMQLLSALIMAGAGLYIAGWFPRFAYVEKLGSRFWKLIEPYGRKLMPVKTRFQAFLFGTVWGWLPCGLVYTSLALAAVSGDIMQSSITMLAFGMGTLPAVMSVGIMTSIMVKLGQAQRFKKIIGVMFIFIAILAAFPWLNPMRLQHF